MIKVVARPNAYDLSVGSDIRANIAGVGAEGAEDFEDAVVGESDDEQLGRIMERAWAFLFIKQLHKKYQVGDYTGWLIKLSETSK